MAMGITQALKLQEGPINTLAQLPQQQLMAMAQQGRIPADMLPIILNEKAEMAQAAANMQAMAKPMPASVTERNMAINAQAEAPRAQPQMMAMAPQQEMPSMDAVPTPIGLSVKGLIACPEVNAARAPGAPVTVSYNPVAAALIFCPV